MITFKQFLIEQSADNLSEPDESSFLREVKSMITRAKMTNRNAAELFDMMQRRPDDFWEWLEDKVVPIWDKYQYPNVGTKEWGMFQNDFKKAFFHGELQVDDKEPDYDEDSFI